MPVICYHCNVLEIAFTLEIVLVIILHAMYTSGEQANKASLNGYNPF